MRSRLRVIASLVLAAVLGPTAAQAHEARIDYELGQTSRAKMVLAQAWWTVAGQTEARQRFFDTRTAKIGYGRQPADRANGHLCFAWSEVTTKPDLKGKYLLATACFVTS